MRATSTHAPPWSLLAVVSGMFDELHSAALEAADFRKRRADCLQRALGEVSRRAAEISPAIRLSCSCGAAFTTSDGLDEHFYDVFVPADDFGLDGRQHIEVGTD